MSFIILKKVSPRLGEEHALPSTDSVYRTASSEQGVTKGEAVQHLIWSKAGSGLERERVRVRQSEKKRDDGRDRW